MNQINLIGRLTKDPEVNQTNSGITYASFTLAVDRPFREKDGEKKADFIPCKAWSHTAEFVAKYFQKGARMGATGSLRIDTYKDREGQTKYRTEINIGSVYFADGKQEPGSRPGSYGSRSQSRPQPGEASEFYDAPDETALPFDL